MGNQPGKTGKSSGKKAKDAKSGGAIADGGKTGSSAVQQTSNSAAGSAPAAGGASASSQQQQQHQSVAMVNSPASPSHGAAAGAGPSSPPHNHGSAKPETETPSSNVPIEIIGSLDKVALDSSQCLSSGISRLSCCQPLRTLPVTKEEQLYVEQHFSSTKMGQNLTGEQLEQRNSFHNGRCAVDDFQLLKVIGKGSFGKVRFQKESTFMARVVGDASEEERFWQDLCNESVEEGAASQAQTGEDGHMSPIVLANNVAGRAHQNRAQSARGN